MRPACRLCSSGELLKPSVGPWGCPLIVTEVRYLSPSRHPDGEGHCCRQLWPLQERVAFSALHLYVFYRSSRLPSCSHPSFSCLCLTFQLETFFPCGSQSVKQCPVLAAESLFLTSHLVTHSTHTRTHPSQPKSQLPIFYRYFRTNCSLQLAPSFPHPSPPNAITLLKALSSLLYQNS